MRTELLRFLRCLSCQRPLHLRDAVLRHRDVASGILRCAREHTVHIRAGIPRFVPSDAYAESFSYEWAKHRQTQYDSHNHNRVSERQLAQYLSMDLRALKGKRILDAGCGSGRFMEIALRYGAMVIGVDLSYAIDVAREQLGSTPRAHFVQADLTRLPFAPGTFDLIYSLGVLHHTPDAARAFAHLPPLLKRNGRIAIFVYSAYNKIISTMSGVWRMFTTRMPKRLLYLLSFIAIPLYYVYRIPLIGSLLKGLFVISMEPNPRVRALDTFDWYSPKYQSKHTHAEVARWFTEAGLQIVAVPPAEISVVGVKR